MATVENYFDSRKNYQKIYLQGTAALSVVTPNVNSSTTIAHNLGYVPNVRVWFTNKGGEVCIALNGGFSTAGIANFQGAYICYFEVTPTNLKLVLDRAVNSGPSVSSTLTYRIYIDAA